MSKHIFVNLLFFLKKKTIYIWYAVSIMAEFLILFVLNGTMQNPQLSSIRILYISLMIVVNTFLGVFISLSIFKETETMRTESIALGVGKTRLFIAFSKIISLIIVISFSSLLFAILAVLFNQSGLSSDKIFISFFIGSFILLLLVTSFTAVILLYIKKVLAIMIPIFLSIGAFFGSMLSPYQKHSDRVLNNQTTMVSEYLGNNFQVKIPTNLPKHYVSNPPSEWEYLLNPMSSISEIHLIYSDTNPYFDSNIKYSPDSNPNLFVINVLGKKFFMDLSKIGGVNTQGVIDIIHKTANDFLALSSSEKNSFNLAIEQNKQKDESIFSIDFYNRFEKLLNTFDGVGGLQISKDKAAMHSIFQNPNYTLIFDEILAPMLIKNGFLDVSHYTKVSAHPSFLMESENIVFIKSIDRTINRWIYLLIYSGISIVLLSSFVLLYKRKEFM